MSRWKATWRRLRPSPRVGGALNQTLGHPLVLLILAVAIFYLFFVPVGNERSSQFDEVLFYFISGVSFMTALFIVVRTRWKDWTVLGAGLFGHFIAVGFVYFLSVWYSTHPIEGYTEELLIFARSLLLISGVLVSIGVVLEWSRDHKPQIVKARSWILHPIQFYRASRDNKQRIVVEKSSQGETHEEAQTERSE